MYISLHRQINIVKLFNLGYVEEMFKVKVSYVCVCGGVGDCVCMCGIVLIFPVVNI